MDLGQISMLKNGEFGMEGRKRGKGKDKAVFSLWTKRFRDTVTLLFVCGNYCLIMV